METKRLNETYAALARQFPSSSSLFASIKQRTGEATKQLRNISPNISSDRVAHILTMEPKVLTETYAAHVRHFPSSSTLFASIRQRTGEATKQLRNMSPNISPDRIAHLLTVESKVIAETYAAFVRHFPSSSSLFASIRQQVREATEQLRTISPDISPDKVAVFIFYVLLYLVDPKSVDLAVLGEKAALVVALDSLPYAEMAGFIATKLLKNPDLQPVILQIIQASVFLFAGEVATVLGLLGAGGMKIKSML